MITLIIIIFIAAGFVTFFYYPKCPNVKCWKDKLESCSKATYINEPIDVTWKYTIKGKNNDKCEVDVKVLEIKRGLKNTEVLEGKEMTCLLPLGIDVKPEANPNICSGRLKEEMQNLIITKLHEYIVQNIGQISGEIAEIEGVTEGINAEETPLETTEETPQNASSLNSTV